MLLRSKNTLFAVGLFACGPQQQPASEAHAAKSESTAPSSSSALSSPAVDDPKSCLDAAELADSTWREGVQRKLDEKLDSLGRCASASEVKREERFFVSTTFSPSGTWLTPPSAMTTLSDCRAVECVEKELSAIKVDPWSSKPMPSVPFEFFLSPNAPPRRPKKGDPPFPFKDAKRCTEDKKPDGVSGRLAPEEIQEIMRSNYSEFRACYEEGLARNRNLEGQVSVRFVIERDGSVTHVLVVYLTLPDCKVVSCLRAAYPKIKFPPPQGGIVTVVYPIMFEPG
jgi:hypothetical protein